MQRKRNNLGNIIIEMTMIIPILLLCMYLYIFLFLYFIEAAKEMDHVSQILYQEENQENSKTNREYIIKKEGSIQIANMQKKGEIFSIEIELRKEDGDFIKKIRRWQLIENPF